VTRPDSLAKKWVPLRRRGARQRFRGQTLAPRPEPCFRTAGLVSHFLCIHSRAHRQELSMCALSSARRYHCARCHQPVMICSDCDRGHIYCFNGCRELAQRERCQRNAKRYQSTQHGRRNNARRQSDYRKRQRAPPTPVSTHSVATSTQSDTANKSAAEPEKTKIVTHRGSATTSASVVLPDSGNSGSFFNCNCCEDACSDYVCTHFL